MKDLLFKDWALIKATRTFLFPLIFLAGGITASYADSPFICIIPIMFTYYIIVNLNAYDYKYNATTFLLSFPIVRKDWVASKYVLSYIVTGISFLLLVAIRTPFWIMGASFANFGLDLTILLLGHAMAIIYIAIIQFGYFKFGYMKMKLFSFVAVVATMAINTVAVRLVAFVGVPLWSVLLFLLVALGFSYLSYQLSLKATRISIAL